MKIKKIALAAVSATAILALGLAGCSNGGGSSSGEKQQSLDVFMSMPTGSPQESKMKEIVAKFEEQENAKINLVFASATFEDDMKVKMASDSVPDVFSTHGWSVIRYSSFLEPLDDRSWVKNVNPGLKNIMFDKDNHIYALPLEYATTGLLTNYDVLEKAGVDPESLTTWESFEDAMHKIKDKLNITPITSSGKESNAGNVADFIASGQFTEAQNKEFQEGKFDPKLWEKHVTDHVQKWQKAGYFNPDYVSASLDDMSRQLADGTAAFGFDHPFVLTKANEYNKDAKLGFMPIPSPTESYLVGGEGVSAFGVSKKSANKELALKFLDFLAQPENAKPLLEAMGAYSGLTNVEVNLGSIQSSFDKYVAGGKVPTKPFFDRVYLPNGMWNTLITTTDGVINGQMTSSEASKQMLDQYTTLFNQQK